MTSAPLPRSAPADQGVASAGVDAFVAGVEAAPDIELHSLMLLRHGHVVAEGWWAPYGPEELHLLYSLSKSFTATAAGLAASEGLLSFDEPFLTYLPELAAGVESERTRSTLVHHLAAMSTGHAEDTLERMIRLDRADPLRAFLGMPPEGDPGSVFAYNNGATYALAAIVQRVTGQTLTDYLRPRLLEPLGVGVSWWHQHPPGRDVGFSGLHLTTEDLACFGQLYLDDGVWQGRRLLPEGWVEQASRLHTPNPAEPNPDWQLGYGYQFWRSRYGYRGDGAYGQFCLVLPEHEAVVVTTGQTENMQGVLDLVWAHLVPALGTTTPDTDGPLAARLAGLALPADGTGLPVSPLPEAQGRLAVRRVDAASANGAGQGWTLALHDGQQEVEVGCGDGEWRRTSTRLADGRQLAVAASAIERSTAAGASELVVQLVFLQTPHRLVLTVDVATLDSTSAWQTFPLHGGTFAMLAVGPATT